MNADFRDFPARLPQGEHVLWQGRPCWRTLALRAFHLRKLAVYFGVLLAWYAATAFTSGETIADASLATLRMTGVALTPLVLICLYAWLSSRGSLYTLTDRRLVLRIGIAMPITFNVPFVKIESAGVKSWPDGHGSIALTLLPTEKIAYLVLWPHAKPWRMARPEPMMRCIPDADSLAQTLSRALAASANMSVQAVPGRASASAAAQPHTPALA